MPTVRTLKVVLKGKLIDEKEFHKYLEASHSACRAQTCK
jgi:hypothetical protein